MSHLYIFDYSDCTINHIETDDDINNEKAKEILKKHGFKESVCNYMISDEELEINYINNDINENNIEENNTDEIIYDTGDVRLRYLEEGTKFKLRAYNLISGKYDILHLKINNDFKCCKDCPLEDYDCSHMNCNFELVE